MKKFYYIRDEEERPIITVCIYKNIFLGTVSKGTAICSEQDIPNKKIGRAIAGGRAKKAALNLGSSGLVKRNDVADELHAHFSMPMGRIYKSCFNPELTEYEEKLISKRFSTEYEEKELFLNGN